MDATNCVIDGNDQYNVCNLFYEYLKRLKEGINAGLSSTCGLTDKQKSGVYSSLHDHATLRISGKVYPESPTTRDRLFAQRLAEFQSLSPDELQMRPEARRPQLWTHALKGSLCASVELNRLDTARTPRTKLQVLANVYGLVMESLKVFSKKKDELGAEDSTPIIVYLLIHSELKQVISSFK